MIYNRGMNDICNDDIDGRCEGEVFVACTKCGKQWVMNDPNLRLHNGWKARVRNWWPDYTIKSSDRAHATCVACQESIHMGIKNQYRDLHHVSNGCELINDGV